MPGHRAVKGREGISAVTFCRVRDGIRPQEDRGRQDFNMFAKMAESRVEEHCPITGGMWRHRWLIEPHTQK